MQSFLTPDKLYFKQGCLPVALRELKDIYHASRVLLITDEEKHLQTSLALVTNALYELGIEYAVNHENFSADAVVGFGYADSLERAAALAGERYYIAVPVSVGWQMSAAAWRRADMFILDEDVCHTLQPGGKPLHIHRVGIVVVL